MACRHARSSIGSAGAVHQYGFPSVQRTDARVQKISQIIAGFVVDGDRRNVPARREVADVVRHPEVDAIADKIGRGLIPALNRRCNCSLVPDRPFHGFA